MPLLTEEQRVIHELCDASLKEQGEHTEWMNQPEARIGFQRGFWRGYKAALAQVQADQLAEVRELVQAKLNARKCGEPVLCNWAGCNDVWKTVMEKPSADDSRNT